MNSTATVVTPSSSRRVIWRERLALPVFTKEMRARMRGRRAPLLLFIFTALAIVVAAVTIAIMYLFCHLSSISYQQAMAQMGGTLFMVLLCVEGSLIALTVPALTAGAISSERERQTLEALLLSPLSTWSILLGKLCSALSFSTIIFLCTLPVMAVAFMFGGVSPGQVLWSMAILLCTSTFLGAVGLWCSAWFRSTVPAVIVSYLLSLLSVAVVPFLWNLYHSATLGNAVVEDFFFSTKLFALAVVAGLLVLFVLAAVRRKSPSRAVLTLLYALLLAGALLFLLLFFNKEEGYHYYLLQFVNFDFIGLSLLYALPVLCLLAMAWRRITLRPLLAGIMLAWYALLALLVFDGGIIYACEHRGLQELTGPLLCGNPFVALCSVIGMSDFGIAEFTNATLPVTWFEASTDVVLVLGAWLMLVLARWRLEQERDCRKVKRDRQLVRADSKKIK